MSSLLKDIYSKEFYHNFSEVLGEVIADFDKSRFMALIFDNDWKEKELKQRMRHTTLVLKQFFPPDFRQSAKHIGDIMEKLRKRNIREASIEFMFLPDYIEVFGIDDYETSVRLIEQVTQFTSCEFAVRPFIIRYGDRMMKQMLRWSKHESHQVRRLTSEGSRPRLPWAIALPELKKNPASILPILENLKNDLSEYVRRSVANNINDIAKDNPGVVIAIAKKWKGESPQTDGIIKHGCRTLLKKGDAAVLKYFRLSDSAGINVKNFKILTPKIAIGQILSFSFSLHNTGRKTTTIRVEYGLYYLLKNGQHYRKVFKINERQLVPGEKIMVSKNHSFRPITTRKYYTGKHKLSLIVNGRERETSAFELVKMK